MGGKKQAKYKGNKAMIFMRNILFIVFSIVILLGCNKDDDRTAIENLLIGEWKLVSFVNELDGTTVNENDVENSGPITIHFKEDFSYTGNTGRNEFFGDYTLNSSEKTVLIFLSSFISEAGETEWGLMYIDSLRLNYNPQTQHIEINFEVSNNTLKIYYSDNEFMKFKRP